ncbi:hypothetical protein FOA52_003035 [Chlamydomonas sp. UWO 241]|nr:hypothetical protein FOA52_003035 [Chlamydomonas sp. UWO 241]
MRTQHATTCPTHSIATYATTGRCCSRGDRYRLRLCLPTFPHPPPPPATTCPQFPISVAAVTSPLAASFTLMPSRANGAGGAHAYYITAKGANSSCYFDAENEPNVLDVRAHEVDVNDDPAVPPSAAYVVMAPFYDLETPKYEPTPNMERFSVLLDRHIQWHTALGFSKYLVYVRQADVIDFAEQRAVQFWGQRGVLHLVLWSEIQPVPHLPHFDQRVVYTHALLALTGANVYAALLDVDDYVVAPAAQSATAATGAPSGQLPRTFPELVRQCGPPGAVVPANLQLPRFHAAMRGFHRTAAEAEFWTARHTEPTHPLTRYSLVNRKRVSAPKSIVRPEFVHTAGIHTAQGRPGINATSAEPACACVLHLQQLLHPREAYSMTRSAMTRAGYAAEPKLEATLLSHAQTIDLNNVMHILPADHVLSDLGGGWF